MLAQCRLGDVEVSGRLGEVQTLSELDEFSAGFDVHDDPPLRRMKTHSAIALRGSMPPQHRSS